MGFLSVYMYIDKLSTDSLICFIFADFILCGVHYKQFEFMF